MTDEDPHILVIDDDQRLRGLLRKYLSDSGFMVSSASDAADAAPGTGIGWVLTTTLPRGRTMRMAIAIDSAWPVG